LLLYLFGSFPAVIAMQYFACICSIAACLTGEQ
jgi:hypothetical protein